MLAGNLRGRQFASNRIQCDLRLELPGVPNPRRLHSHPSSTSGIASHPGPENQHQLNIAAQVVSSDVYALSFDMSGAWYCIHMWQS